MRVHVGVLGSWRVYVINTDNGESNLCARLASHVCAEFESNSANGLKGHPGVISQFGEVLC